MLRVAIVVSLLSIALSSCAQLVDPDRERICRLALPALNEQTDRISLLRVASGPGENDVTIEYRVYRDGGARNRSTICRFARDAVSAQRNDLVGIATEIGPLGDASFYFLKRFYLADPDNARFDPLAATQRVSVTPNVPFIVAYTAQQLLGAVPAMVSYSLMGAAYALIFGLVGRVILGFGEFAAIGGAATVSGAVLVAPAIGTQAALMMGAAMAVWAASIHGLAVARGMVVPLQSARGQQVLIASVGLLLVLGEYVRLAQGGETAWLAPFMNRTIPLLMAPGFTTTVTPATLLAAGVGLVILSLLLWLMARTGYGRAWRAYADDPLAAALMGVDGSRLLSQTFVLACGLSGLAGAVITLLFGAVGFAAGFALGLKALIAAVIGGIGSVGGAIVGGVVLALVETLWVMVLPVEFRDAALYGVLAFFLITRPHGLFGRDETGERRT